MSDGEVLSTGTRLFAEPFELPKALSQLTRLVREHLEVDLVRLWIREKTGEFRLQAEAGELPSPLGSGQALLTWLTNHRKPLMIPDLEDPQRVGSRPARALEATSLLGASLWLGDEALGVLTLLSRDRSNFHASEIAVVEALASSAAVAIANARYHRQESLVAGQARELEEIIRAVASARDLQEILREVSQRAARLCQADSASVFLWDDEAKRVSPAMAQLSTGQARDGAWKRFKGMGTRALEDMVLIRKLQETREPITIDDARRSPDIDQAWVQAFEVKSILGVPLVAAERVVGQLILNSVNEVRPFSPRQVELAVAVANQMAFAIQKTQLLQKTQDRLRQTQAHLEIARTLSSTLELTPLLCEVTRQAARACGTERCSIFLYESNHIVPVMSQYADGRTDEDLWRAFRSLGRVQAGDLPVFGEIHQHRPVLSEHPADDSRLPPALEIFGLKSLMVVPLVRQDRVIGGMALDNSTTADPITQEQMALATTIASPVALAIDNARLYGDTQRRLREAEVQVEISRTLSSTLKTRQLLKEITSRTAQACNMDGCGVQLWEEGRVVPMMAQYADGRADPGAWETFKELRGKRLDELPYLTQLIRTRGPVIIDNPETSPLWPPFLHLFGTKAVLVVPLVRQEEIVGAMVLTNVERTEPIAESQVTLAITLASQVALALENARLYEETQRRLNETQALLRVSKTLGSSLDRQELARSTSRELTHLLGADTSVFYEIDDATSAVVMLAGYHLPESLGTVATRISPADRAPFITEAAKRGKPVSSTELAKDPRFNPPTLPFLPVQPRSFLCTPLVSQGRELGGLLSFWWTEEHPFTVQESRLAAGIANQIVLLLENARHYDQARRALADLRATQDRLVGSERFRALAEMAGGVAHDFKNLLTAIRGRAQLLQRQVEGGQVTPAEIRSNLDVIELAALDGAETVRRLLDYTQAEPHSDHTTLVDVNELLVHTKEASRHRWKHEIEAKGHAIEISLIPEDVPRVTGNPAELREVLLNLVFNAIDAMPFGGSLTLASSRENDHVCLHITDTGVGMSEEVRKRIFDPFFTTKGAGSSGLGLSASYGIVHRHGGRIAVASEPGQGTTFTVQLPL